jgi:hypothetical protein
MSQITENQIRKDLKAIRRIDTAGGLHGLGLTSASLSLESADILLGKIDELRTTSERLKAILRHIKERHGICECLSHEARLTDEELTES